jgi:uncharacterized membrane protein YeaQ/YmgE (transglycosylase-associated protein family)
MLGMSFLSFLVVTIIGAVVAVTYHDIFRYRFLEGTDARFGKLIIGWLGAWLGSPVFGNWFWKIENVYIIPAILGAAAAIHLSVLVWKARAKLIKMRALAAESTREEVRPKTSIAA